jgi:predicted transcriptional regulator
MELPPETNRMLQRIAEAINQQSQKSDRQEEVIRQIFQRITLTDTHE